MCKNLRGLSRLFVIVLLISLIPLTSACIKIVPNTITSTTTANMASTTAATTATTTNKTTTTPTATSTTTNPATTTPTTNTATTGSLEVNCSQYDANVYVDGKPEGHGAPGIADNIGGLLPGTYTVELTRSGYKDWNKQVTIVAGKIPSSTVTLNQAVVPQPQGTKL